MTSLGHGPAATVKTISISADSNNKNLSGLATAAGITPGTNVYSLNLNNINTRIASVPDVKKSAVRRLPNGNLAIKVELHKAVALWSDGENFFPLSADGTIIKRNIGERPSNTIVFRGSLPNDITEITKATQIIAKNINYLEWVEDRRWNIRTINDTTILLPEENPFSAISNLMVLDKDKKILSKKIKTLDMRDPARIIVK